MDFYGLPTTCLENDFLQLEMLSQAGPRIVRLRQKDSAENLLAETPDITLPSSHGPYRLYGGHRLWHAPEDRTRTYYPDDQGVDLEISAGFARVTGPVEPPTGIQKSMDIHLEVDRPALTITHRLTNHGLWTVELAPWAITMLPLGGRMILPQPSGPWRNALLPNRRLALWPYTRLNDPRLELGDDFIYLDAQADLNPIKIGYFNTGGWAAYQRNGIRLIKRFIVNPAQNYPDEGCNLETYCWNRFIELETLGPLARLTPGETIEHIEIWEIAAHEN